MLDVVEDVEKDFETRREARGQVKGGVIGQSFSPKERHRLKRVKPEARWSFRG